MANALAPLITPCVFHSCLIKLISNNSLSLKTTVGLLKPDGLSLQTIMPHFGVLVVNDGKDFK